MKQIDPKQLRFVIYLRKSSDSEDKQVASIPQQKKELTELAAREGLHIVATLIETHSAYRPGRPKFQEMLEMIEGGKVDAVLAWSASRISRNSLDGGAFLYKFENKKLKAFKTIGRTIYGSSDDSFTLDIDLGIAKKSSADLSEAVLRGNRYKFYEKKEWVGLLNQDT